MYSFLTHNHNPLKFCTVTYNKHEKEILEIMNLPGITDKSNIIVQNHKINDRNHQFVQSFSQ